MMYQIILFAVAFVNASEDKNPIVSIGFKLSEKQKADCIQMIKDILAIGPSGNPKPNPKDYSTKVNIRECLSPCLSFDDTSNLNAGLKTELSKLSDKIESKKSTREGIIDLFILQINQDNIGYLEKLIMSKDEKRMLLAKKFLDCTYGFGLWAIVYGETDASPGLAAQLLKAILEPLGKNDEAIRACISSSAIGKVESSSIFTYVVQDKSTRHLTSILQEYIPKKASK